MRKCGIRSAVVFADEMSHACEARLGPPTGGLAVPHHATPPTAPSLPPPYVSPARLSVANGSSPIVKRKGEAEFSEYLTKRLILERSDNMIEAENRGDDYQTILDPHLADLKLRWPDEATLVGGD